MIQQAAKDFAVAGYYQGVNIDGIQNSQLSR
jgi:hypothetical protein